MTEKEGKVIVAEDNKLLFSAEEIDLCLTVKLISNKMANNDALESAMKNVWRVNHNTRIEPAGDNVLFILFKSKMEKARVMNSGPWIFDKSHLVIVAPRENDQIGELQFSSEAF
ncbi:DUF4283 domain-containing protein [Sweet potato little leaf phytoplasma]|uniref:DUF4283 domain-containing protein n=1 Tax=Candidatus Phytoplasma australasiaticum TaxID=2754999 RepID=UPI002713D1E7|nr:DUF4283 domain-containing protein [Sweet potato little leaf phytoplasma]MDO7987412.1 DUF4283 domain-containing protein [Sweet potato little leaf phytoplasma]